MKKKVIWGSLCFLLLLLSGCSKNPVEIEKIPETQHPVLNMEAQDVVEVSEPENGVNDAVVYDDAVHASVKSYLKRLTYIDVEQTIESGVANEDPVMVSFYSIKSDVDSKIAEFTVNLDGVERHYINDFKEDLTYEFIDGEWQKIHGTIMMIDWDIDEYDSAWNVYKYLTDGITIKKGTEGYRSGDFEYYTTKSKAKEGIVSGVKYDELGEQEVTYIFRVLNSVRLPVSVIVDVGYTVGNKDYYIRALISFKEISSSSMEMPSVDGDNIVERD